MSQIKNLQELTEAAASSALRAAAAHNVAKNQIKVQSHVLPGHGTWVGIILPPDVVHASPTPAVIYGKHPIWIGIIAEGLDKSIIEGVQHQIEGQLR